MFHGIKTLKHMRDVHTFWIWWHWVAWLLRPIKTKPLVLVWVWPYLVISVLQLANDLWCSTTNVQIPECVGGLVMLLRVHWDHGAPMHHWFTVCNVCGLCNLDKQSSNMSPSLDSPFYVWVTLLVFKFENIFPWTFYICAFSESVRLEGLRTIVTLDSIVGGSFSGQNSNSAVGGDGFRAW